MDPLVSSPPEVQVALLVGQDARRIAQAQQVKDTLTIVCMNVMLLVPIAWPGLVLYALRWRQTRRGARPSPVLWVLTLLHELLCLWLFASIKPGSDMAELGLFAISYVFGTLFSIAALVTLWFPPASGPHGASGTTARL